MRCKQVHSLLVSYLDHEITPSERTLVQAHLSGCAACQQELSLMIEIRGKIGSVLQRRAAQAAPSPDAWERLNARLAEVAQPSPTPIRTWLSRLAPGASRISAQLFSGGVTMRRKIVLTALVAGLIITLVVIFNANTVTPVSAKDILEQAYTAQSAVAPSQGIEHLRSEMYTNLQALPQDQGMDAIVDSYHDLQSGYTRLVTTDNKTGKVLDVFACDGTYTYSTGGIDAARPADGGSDLLTVYRSPQSISQEFVRQESGGDALSAKDLFDQMRNDPNVQLVGQETWPDGRKVYVLQSQQQIKVIADGEMQRPFGQVTVYFETSTYEMLGNRVTMEKDGQEILISSHKVLVNEILPVGSPVTWDLSDLQSIRLVDDPDRLHGDLLPEDISTQELTKKTQNAYLLREIPSGFTLAITAPPMQSANEPYIYIASYRSETGDYFVIQAASLTDAEFLLKEANESYTTANGLTMHFMNIESGSEFNGKSITTAIVEAPDGVRFMLNSTLPPDTVKAWAEGLVLVK